MAAVAVVAWADVGAAEGGQVVVAAVAKGLAAMLGAREGVGCKGSDRQ